MLFIKLLILFNFNLINCFRNFGINKAELKNKPTNLISLNTSLGTLIGYKQNVQNKTINVFYGVPYAEPPIKKLRFKKSKLINKFPSEPYLALDYKPHCILKFNPKSMHPNDSLSEDCLYMNIWTPSFHLENEKCSKNYSVLINIVAGEIYKIII